MFKSNYFYSSKKLNSYHLPYLDLLLFHLPLVLNATFMSLSTPFLNIGLSRAENQELALSSFTAAFSIMIVFYSLIFSSNRVFNSLLKDKKSYKAILSFSLCIALISASVFIFLGSTNIGAFLIQALFKTSEGVNKEIQYFLLSSSLSPFLAVFRNSYQGIATVYKRPQIMTITIFTRISVAFMTILLLLQLLPTHPGTCSGLAFTSGILAESILLYFLTLRYRSFPSSTSVKKYTHQLTWKYLLKYFIPIWTSSLAWTLSFPIVNFFIGQTINQETGLAGFGVLRSIMILLSAPLYSLSTLMLIFGRGKHTLKKLRKYSILVTLIITTIIFLTLSSQLKFLLLKGIFNLSDLLLREVLLALPFFILIPVITTLRFYPEGFFMRQQKPQAAGIAGIIRLIIIIISGFLMIHYYPNCNGTVLGTSLMTIAGISDALVMLISYHIFKRQYLKLPSYAYSK